MGSTESYKKRKSIGYDWDNTNGCNSSSRITVDESQNNLTVGPRDIDQRLIALMKEIKTEIYPWDQRFIDKYGAEVNNPGGKHCNKLAPLHDAAGNGPLDIVKILVCNGASIP